MAAPYSDDQLRLAARLYYVDNMGQADVARFVRVSQAKVSRMLALARERGIVRISVAEYEPRHAAIERRLCDAFGLRAAAVVKSVAGGDEADARRTTGHFGAEFVHALVPDGACVAIAGGRTMRELVTAIPEANRPGLTVIQAMGSIDSTVGPVDALELGRTLAQRWKGRFMTINTPAFVPDRATRDAFLQLPQLRELWSRLRNVDTALVGVGTLENSIFADHRVLSEQDAEALRKAGATGEICGRFFDRNGRECRTPWRDRVISIPLEQLQQVPLSIAVVAGADRAAALAAAIRGGLIRVLVIDEEGALALLQTSRTRSSRRSTRHE